MDQSPQDIARGVPEDPNASAAEYGATPRYLVSVEVLKTYKAWVEVEEGEGVDPVEPLREADAMPLTQIEKEGELVEYTTRAMDILDVDA